MVCLFSLLLCLRGRHNFLNLFRYGSYCEKSSRLHYEKSFDFLSFNLGLLERYSMGIHLLVFDQSFVAQLIGLTEVSPKLENEEVRLYECVVNAKKLKRNISLCYVMEMKAGKSTGKYQLLFSTDTTLAALSIYRFYKTRFLIEFYLEMPSNIRGGGLNVKHAVKTK